jgi:hypothetical protein
MRALLVRVPLVRYLLMPFPLTLGRWPRCEGRPECNGT